jgi:hypothetical protein
MHTWGRSETSMGFSYKLQPVVAISNRYEIPKLSDFDVSGEPNINPLTPEKRRNLHSDIILS